MNSFPKKSQKENLNDQFAKVRSDERQAKG